MPVRSLQRLFSEDGVSFTDFVARERLTLAYRTLRDIALADRPISTVAFDCGFQNVSHFNRVFRLRFGASPSDVARRRGTRSEYPYGPIGAPSRARAGARILATTAAIPTPTHAASASTMKSFRVAWRPGT